MCAIARCVRVVAHRVDFSRATMLHTADIARILSWLLCAPFHLHDLLLNQNPSAASSHTYTQRHSGSQPTKSERDRERERETHITSILKMRDTYIQRLGASAAVLTAHWARINAPCVCVCVQYMFTSVFVGRKGVVAATADVGGLCKRLHFYCDVVDVHEVTQYTHSYTAHSLVLSQCANIYKYNRRALGRGNTYIYTRRMLCASSSAWYENSASRSHT